LHTIEFEYSLYKGLPVPLIPVEIKGKDGWHEIWVFVDSGATYSVFESKVADMLGIDFHSGKRLMIIVGDGSYIPVYFHKIGLKIGEIEIVADIGFSDKLGVGFNLLGRKDIFERFKVCFSDKENLVTFTVLE